VAWSVTDSVASHGALRPLAAVRPPTTALDAQPMPLALHPLPREVAAVRPRVDAARLEPGLPLSGVLALVLRSRADAMSVSATLVRPAAVRSAVIEVEMADGSPRLSVSLLRRISGDGGRVVGAERSAHRPADDVIDGVVGTLTTTS